MSTYINAIQADSITDKEGDRSATLTISAARHLREKDYQKQPSIGQQKDYFFKRFHRLFQGVMQLK